MKTVKGEKKRTKQGLTWDKDLHRVLGFKGLKTEIQELSFN